ncbi:MAG: Rid family hydrolase [bacterium]
MIEKRPMRAPDALNEAYEYDNPVPFSRGFRIDIKGITILLISGTASVNEKGESIHIGDFDAQARRMLDNVTRLLKSEGADWHDVVRTTFFVKDIDRHYQRLSRIRMDYFRKHGLKQFPASTGVQARLCRRELLVEMEAIAIFETRGGKKKKKKTSAKKPKAKTKPKAKRRRRKKQGKPFELFCIASQGCSVTGSTLFARWSKLKIDGLTITGFDACRDERGWNVHPFDEKRLAEGELANLHVVSMAPGTIRGNHFHRSQTEQIMPVGGPCLFRAADSRTGERYEEVFDAETPVRVKVEPGVAHVFRNISDRVIHLICASDTAYDPQNPDSESFPLND